MGVFFLARFLGDRIGFFCGPGTWIDRIFSFNDCESGSCVDGDVSAS